MSSGALLEKQKVRNNAKNRKTSLKEVRKFESKYGYFTEDGREYVITRPDTPRPWVNVISNGDYGLIESQTGSGFSWLDNSNLSRITRWEQDLIKDEWGKYIYIRDNHTEEVWSATWKPCCPKFDSFEVRHGQGYSILKSLYKGIRVGKTIFVDRHEPAEVWNVELTNESDTPRSLSLFSHFEWCLGNAADTHREFQKTFVETEIDRENGILYGWKRPALVPGFISTGLSEKPLQAFHAATNVKPVAYDGDKETFLGMYGDVKLPKSVRAGKLLNTEGKHYDSIAALQVNVELNPGETKKVVFVLGAAANRKKIKQIVEKYEDESAVEKALNEVKALWDEFVNATFIETPDDALNFMTNIWLKYQAISGRIWAKCGYYQSSGGYGFRDQLQDSHVFLPTKPELTKKQIILHAEHQFSDGTVYHWWHQGTSIGAITGSSDDLLWLVFLTIHYIQETADYSILDEKIDFLPDLKTKKVEKASLYIHCLRAIDKVFSRWSKRGLPLIGECDWNDGLSHVGIRWKGESIWLGQFFYGILKQFAPYCERKKEATRAKNYVKRAETLKQAIEKYAWDGEWYIGATKDNGEPLGSKSCKQGKIFLNTQTWAVINNMASPERAKKCMQSAEKYLFREFGPLLLTPAYSVTDPTIGYITRYAPAVRENGGLYTHAGTWAVQAVAMTGDGDKAYKAYCSFNPPLRGLDPDIYYVEPYVTPGNVDGPDSPHFGRGGWTWYTGSAAWSFRIALDYMLGIHAVEEGLQINPAIPKDWKGYNVKRFFRGAIYQMTVKNPKHVSTGVKQIKVNGNKIEGNLVVPQKGKGPHQIEVILG